MEGTTQRIYQNITYLDVGCVERKCMTTNNAEGGRKVLGLPQAWTVVRRNNRSAEVVAGGRQKVCPNALYFLSHMLEWQLASWHQRCEFPASPRRHPKPSACGVGGGKSQIS